MTLDVPDPNSYVVGVDVVAGLRVYPAITSPTNGSTVQPVHDVIGTAQPNMPVHLWSTDRNPEGDPNASTTADDTGAWAFTGDTPARVGPLGWFVRSVGLESDHVYITVEDTAPVAATRRAAKAKAEPEAEADE